MIHQLLAKLAGPLLLWGGLLVLCAMGAALRLTQWGRWHLVRKCLLLSVLAHLLFLIEAHGLQVLVGRSLVRDETAAFELEKVIVGTTPGSSTGHGQVDLWDQFARRIPDQPVPIRRSRPDAAETLAQRSPQAVPDPESPEITPARVAPRPTPTRAPQEQVDNAKRLDPVSVRPPEAPKPERRPVRKPEPVPVPQRDQGLRLKRRPMADRPASPRPVAPPTVAHVQASSLRPEQLLPTRAVPVPEVQKTAVVKPLSPQGVQGRPKVAQRIRARKAPPLGVPRVRPTAQKKATVMGTVVQRQARADAPEPAPSPRPAPARVQVRRVSDPTATPAPTVRRVPVQTRRPVATPAPRPEVNVRREQAPVRVETPDRTKRVVVRHALPRAEARTPFRRLPAGRVYRGPSHVMAPRPTFVKSAPAAGRTPQRVRPKPIRPEGPPAGGNVRWRRLPMLGPQIYRRRRPEKRLSVALLYGGTKQSEAAVERALAWLAKHQESDGHWSVNGFARKWDESKEGAPGFGRHAYAHSAVTGLCTLAFLGAGYTHQGGRYGRVVGGALRWYERSMAKDGDLSDGARMYSHAISTFAVCEALAMTRDRRLEPLASKAVAYLVQAQHQPSGGWRYFPRQFGDTSVHGWVVMALRSGLMAGVDVPEATFDGARRWLDAVTGGKYGGLYRYQPGDPVTLVMTAEGLASSLFLGVRHGPAIDEAAGMLLENLPQWDRPNMYYWYYATMSAYQLKETTWKRWNEALRDMLVRHQRVKGIGAGSWDPVGRYGQDGGRLYATALSTLCLEVYYRYLPLYRSRALPRR